MTQKAIITDLNRCTGCLACTVACKAINGVPPAEAMELLLGRLKKVKTNIEILLTLQPGNN